MKLVPLFLFLISISGLSATQKNFQTSFEMILDEPYYKIEKIPLYLADNLGKLYKVSAKGYINAKLIKTTLKEIERQDIFVSFKPWLNQLLKIASIKDKNKLLRQCEKIRKLKSKAGLERYFKNQSLYHCRLEALKKVSANQRRKGLTPLEIEFLKQNIQSFFARNLRKEFISFLQKLTTNQSIKLAITGIVKDWYLKTQRPFKTDLLSYVEVDEELTSHIQKHGLYNSTDNKILVSELLKIQENIYELVDNEKPYLQIKASVDALINYVNLLSEDDFINSVWKKLSDTGKILWRAGYPNLAHLVYRCAERNTDKEIQEDIFFNLMWEKITDKKFSSVISSVMERKYHLNYQELNDAKLKFWIAYSYHRLGKTDISLKIFDHIIKKHPFSFYSVIASKMARKSDDEFSLEEFHRLMNHESKISFSPELISIELKKAWHRLRFWGKLDHKPFIDAEISFIHQEVLSKIVEKVDEPLRAMVLSDLHILTAGQFFKAENYLESFKSVYKSLRRNEVSFNNFLFKILYPVPYLEKIKNRLGKDSSIDPVIILSLIRQESVFNPNARSVVGARGLMQLMPSTARQMKRFRNTSKLHEPDFNLQLGIRYFKKLFKYYEGNLVYSLAAYNAGQTRVKRWKKKYFTNDNILMDIESIPFSETRNYVKLIFRNIFFYKGITGFDPKEDPTDLDKIHQIKLW